MPTKLSLYLLLITTWFAAAPAQIPDTLWTKLYGDTRHDEATCLTATADNCYVAGCGGLATLMKFDEQGDTLWCRDYGVTATSILQTLDGGYAVTVAEGDKNLIKTDGSGDSLWSRDYDMNVFAARQTSDGGYILSGSANVEGYLHCCLLKTDSLGFVDWQHTYAIGEVATGNSLELTDDGGYFTAGPAHFEANCWDYFLLKVGASGDSVWTKTYGYEVTPEEAYGMIQCDDGGFLISGLYFWTVRTDAAGDTLWTDYYGYGEIGCAYSILQAADDGFLLGGTIDPSGGDDGEFCLIKIDDDGYMEWLLLYGQLSQPGGGSLDMGQALVKAHDGSLIMAGKTRRTSADDFNVWLIKIGRETGISENLFSMPDNFGLLRAFPNPFNLSTTITFDMVEPGRANLRLYDLLGREIMTIDNRYRPAGEHHLVFDAVSLPSGIYFFELQAGDRRSWKKITLIK